LQRLSSGLRINSAKDDAAGLAISERMTAQIRGYNQAIRNAGDGTSLVQTAEGGLEAITNSLQRMRELAVQGANDTYGTGDRAALQLEVDALADEIVRVASQTSFNGQALLDGSLAGVIQVGAGASASDRVTIPGIMNMEDILEGPTDLSTAANAASALGVVDTAIGYVTSARASLGATINRFEQVIDNLRVSVENLSASRSRIQDADFAAETAALTRAQILQQSGTAVLSQANMIPQNVLSLLR
jgi:flagellin